MDYRCVICGEVHDDIPDVGFNWPDHYFDVPEEERDSRIVVSEDTCKIDDQYCFIRCVLLIPISGESTRFGLGVWISQKPENYQTYLDNFDSSEIGPFFGWLCNTIAFYERDTQLLKTMAYFQGSSQRPVIELQECDHQLYRDWSEGITMERALEYVHWRETGIRA